MSRFSRALVVAFLLAATLAAAQGQGGFRGGFRGGWGGETGMPPRFPGATDFDGTFHFCRLMYTQVRRQERGLGWGTDYPYADINFSIRLSELTKTKVGWSGAEPNHLVVRPTDEALFQCPFVLASDPGSAGFSAADAAGLREYLLKGGFLWVDDFWGPWAWQAFADEIAKALPPSEYPIRELTPEHPIYHMLFTVNEIPQVPSIQFWRQSGGETSEMGEYSARAHMAAIADKHGRVMVLMTHNTDISDSWEREGEDPRFFFSFSPNGYAVALNSVLYAMTH
ncbi:MAG: DUF4159 domain-containing protein [Vicinamibacterales bacterium]